MQNSWVLFFLKWQNISNIIAKTILLPERMQISKAETNLV